MSATLFFTPRARFLTPQVTAMSGAKLQFYETESTTPANVYEDAALNTSLGSLIEADVNGEFIALYLDSRITYRIILFDQNDVEQWDIDPYLPSRDYEPGTVIMWFGAAVNLEAAYPSALWQICDGTNSSPNMQGRVPIGTGGGFAVNDSGGATTASFTTATDGLHQHTSVTSGAHALTVAEMPSHGHDFAARQRGNGANAGGSRREFFSDDGALFTNDNLTGLPYVGSTGGGSTHTHPNGVAATTGSAHAHNGSVSTMQPYRALYFLMRRYP